MPYIQPPARPRWWLRLLLWVTKKVAGRDMSLPRLLTWSPKLAVASGLLESAATRAEGKLTPRLLKLVRLEVSLRAACAFCLDMNSPGYAAIGITSEEILALQRHESLERIGTLSAAERSALKLVRALTQTPISIDQEIAGEALRHFSEREYLLLAATCAQVNYWARLAQGLGVAPEGFAPDCEWLYKPANAN